MNYRIEMAVTNGYAAVQVIDIDTDAILEEQNDLTAREAMEFTARYITEMENGK